MSQHPTDLFRTSCGATAPLELNVSGPGWAGSERRVFEHPFVLVGRHKRSDLRLKGRAISPRHVYLQQLGGKVFCVDLGSRTGIHWGGEPRPAGWLRPDQGVQIGPFSLQATAAGVGGRLGERTTEDWDPLQDRSDDDPRLVSLLTVEVGNEIVSRLRMNRVLVLVGSSPACWIRLQDGGVARYHCSLVRTPEGVWVIDLLNDSATCLNGQPIRWALLKEGDRLKVGGYGLRVWYPDKRAETPPAGLSAFVGEIAVRPANDAPAPSLSSPPLPPPPGGLPVPVGSGSVQAPALQAELDQIRELQRDIETLEQQLADVQAERDGLCGRVRELESQVTAADGLQAQFRATSAETERLRVRLRDAESQAAELEAVRGERDRFRERTGALEAQVAEAAGLRERLEAAEADTRELDIVRAEREEERQQIQAAQQQLAAEREAGRAAGTRLDQMSDALQRMQADLTARNAELDAASQRLQEAQDELARSRDEALGLRIELERTLERQRAAESQAAELEVVRAECDRFRERAGVLETQVAEAAGLREQLEAGARELAIVRAERDRWQAEMQALQDARASESAERKQEQQQLEATQQQLIEERETVRAATARLNQMSATLQETQADLAARSAELHGALQRLQESQDELARSQDKARDLQAELEQIWQRQRAAESQAAELEVVRAECDRFRERAGVLEAQVAEAAGLREQLEAGARELAIVRAERDRWQAEMQALQDARASESAEREQFSRRAADLHAAQVERDRPQTEPEASQHAVEQAWAQVSDLERAQTEAAAAHETALEGARVGGASEPQALEARLALERQTHDGTVQAEARSRGRWYRPLDGLLAVLVVVLAFLAASFAVRNGDFWFHLATGRLLAHRQFTVGVDPFAYTTQGIYWTHHAWLFDLLLYYLYGSIGGAGIVLIKALLVAALAWLLMRLRRPDGIGWVPAACAALTVLAMSPYLLLRSTCLSYVFFGLSFWLLAKPHTADSAVPDNKHYLHLPLLFILWVNFDEWFLLGPLLILLFWISEWFQGCRRMPGWLVPASLAACLLSPHGYHAFTLPAELSPVTWTSGLRHDVRFERLFASPWQSTGYLEPATWQNASALAYFALVILGLISFFLHRQALRSWRLLVWLSFGLLAAWQMCVIPFFAIVAGPIAALNLQDFIVGWRESRLRMSLVGRLVLLLDLLGLIFLAWPGWLQGYGHSDRHVAWAIQPDASLCRAAEVLRNLRRQGKLSDGERVFALDPEVVQYFSWFCPEEKHFFDHRYPLFPQVAREYEIVCQALNGDRSGERENGAPTDWRQILRDRNVGVVVLYDQDTPRLLAAEQRLAGDPQHWVLLDSAGRAQFFGWKEARPSNP